VIVHHLDLVGVAVLPHEADPILVVDPDAVLPLPVARERLRSVARKRAKILELRRGVDLRQLALGHTRDALKPSRVDTLEQRLRFRVPKGPDHRLT